MKKTKTKLQKQYENILKTPQDKINIYYFVAIHDYLKLIDENNALRNALHNHESFELTRPYNLTIILAQNKEPAYADSSVVTPGGIEGVNPTTSYIYDM